MTPISAIRYARRLIQAAVASTYVVGTVWFMAPPRARPGADCAGVRAPAGVAPAARAEREGGYSCPPVRSRAGSLCAGGRKPTGRRNSRWAPPSGSSARAPAGIRTQLRPSPGRRSAVPHQGLTGAECPVVSAVRAPPAFVVPPPGRSPGSPPGSSRFACVWILRILGLFVVLCHLV